MRCAVPVEMCPRHGKRLVEGFSGGGEKAVRRANDIEHPRRRHPHRRRSERQVEHASEVLLKLIGRTQAIHRIVAGIVRARGNLVEEDGRVLRDEELNAKDPSPGE